MERRLYEAALEGNVESLFELLQEDALILDRVVMCAETPLHIAAMLGHVTFAKEILSCKRELADEFDFQKNTPLHLASAKGHVEIVKLLLSINHSVCLAQDRNGRTPLHLAAMKDRVEVLNELIRAKPEACWIRDDRGQTILHLCITHNGFETLKLLVHSMSDGEFIEMKDDDGNNILHLTVINKQLKMLNFLLHHTKIKVNTLNAYGFTALDVLSQSPRDLKDIDILESLQQAGAVKAKDVSLRRNTTNDQISTEHSHSKGSSAKDDPPKNNDWLMKKYNTLMVVASLITTMAFQVGVNPPGGLWQDTNPGHKAGFSIMATNYPYAYKKFLVSDTIGFIGSISIILLLISGLPLKHRFCVWIPMIIMWVAITSMVCTYLTSISTFTPNEESTTLCHIVRVAVLSWIGLMGLLLLGNSIHLMVRLFRKFEKFVMRMIWPSNSRMSRNCINV